MNLPGHNPLNKQEQQFGEANNVQINVSRQFTSWLYEQNASLAFSTYQAGKLFMIGTNRQGNISVSERSFPRCMGLGKTTTGFWMSSLFQMWRFENSLQPGIQFNEYDKVYLPRVSYITGDLDIHDIIVSPEDAPLFVNTLFSCISTISETHSFKPIWKPSFITKLAAEDRCHLNGMASRDGKPAYVTAVSQSDLADGWREKRINGGIVIDVESNEIISSMLSMPHSPRLYNGKLYLLEAGSGYFGFIDLQSGNFQKICFCPGFLRGMDFINNYAVVGLSSNRENSTFNGLQLDDNLKKHKVDPWCGIQVIDLNTGDVVHWLRLEGLIRELYDIQIFPGVRRPLLIGIKTDEIRRMISIE